MSKRQNLLAVWQQIPIANRTVVASTVSDKTGYSLTAGSYVVRASSTQTARATVGSGAGSQTATISSVTVTRATVINDGGATPSGGQVEDLTDIELTNATTITVNRNSTPARVAYGRFFVLELF